MKLKKFPFYFVEGKNIEEIQELIQQTSDKKVKKVANEVLKEYMQLVNHFNEGSTNKI